MHIARKMPASTIEYFPPYKEPDKEFLINQLKELINWIWKDYPNPVLQKEIIPDYECILTIVDLVERRRIYYHVFHNCMVMNECKEVALYCYWILKLQPFLKYKNNKDGKPIHHLKQGNEVNSIIAYRLLVNIAKAVNKHLPTGTLKPLLHSFRYHDISKESLIALCESLFEENI